MGQLRGKNGSGEKTVSIGSDSILDTGPRPNNKVTTNSAMASGQKAGTVVWSTIVAPLTHGSYGAQRGLASNLFTRPPSGIDGV